MIGLKERLDKNKIPYFICIGSMKSMLDSIAPRIGTKLHEKGYKVIGTEDSTLIATNIEKRYREEISMINTCEYQLIYIDVTRDNERKPYEIFIADRPLNPGSAFGKELPTLGEWFIGINLYKHGESAVDFYNKMLSHNYGEDIVSLVVELCVEKIERTLHERYN